MRVAVVVPGFPSEPDDPCLPYLADFVATLSPAHDLEVFSISFPHEARTFALHGARVACFGAGGRLGKLVALSEVPAAIERRHRERPFDLVHAWWAGLPGAVGARAARRLGIPLVVSIGGREVSDDVGPVTRALVAASLRAADRVTVGSEWLRARVAADGGPWPAGARPIVLPLGVDTARFSPGPGVPAGSRPPSPCQVGGPVRRGRRVLFVGALTPLKDPLIVVRAVARVPGDVTLRVLGAGPLEDEVRRVAAEEGVAVRLDGAVRPSQVAAAMRDADLLVCASRWESQGLVVGEALATGLPVVATGVGFAADVGAPLVRTWAGDRGVLTEVIAGVLADRAHAERVAEEGPALVAERASTQAMAVAVEGLWGAVR